MARTAAFSLMFVVTALGFGVPAVFVYCSVYHNFNSIVAGIISIIALVIAGAIGFFGIVTGSFGEITTSEGWTSAEREKLNMIRAHQRATLEELDDIIALLKEIRDVLQSAQE